MRVAAADDRLLGSLDVCDCNRFAISEAVYLLHALARQRIHQPGLPAAPLHDGIEHVWLECLPRRGGVLGIEFPNLLLVEVAEGEVLRDDVERTLAAERLGVRAHLRLHVADVHHADDGDGRRERDVVARDVAVAQFAKERNRRPLRKAVNLVEEHDKRFPRLLREHGKKQLHPKIRRLGEKFRDRRRRIADEFAEKRMSKQVRPHAFDDLEYPVVRIGVRLHAFHREVERDALAGGVDVTDKSLEERGLAGLSCCVDGKILIALHEAHDFGKPLRRRKHVVPCRIARPCDVEELFHGGKYTTNPRIRA